MSDPKNTPKPGTKADQKNRSNASPTQSKHSNKPAGDLASSASHANSYVLPNSLRLKAPNSAHSRQNMSSILRRLPFLQQLNATQNSAQKLKPTWLAWCKQCQKQHGSLALKLDQHASPTSLKQGTMSIACDNTGAASLIKHQKTSLLKAFHNAGFDEISHIHVQMELTKTRSKPAARQNQQSSDKHRPAPSAAAVKSIEATQSLIENEQLAASLKRLAQTLKSSASD